MSFEFTPLESMQGKTYEITISLADLFTVETKQIKFVIESEAIQDGAVFAGVVIEEEE